MKATNAQRLRDIETGHAKLKRMHAELAMENHSPKDLMARWLDYRDPQCATNAGLTAMNRQIASLAE
ncbi:hypothetical protein GCM10010981_09820 [Dyella nitratireducens]|uniref:Transposase n=1 Tax=Dyella nitratireducens TaxID=1849580 RepID=A0ABQ1FPI6_9GAMM|nr:hypothetical protein [Dyella nitratireducens]GGA23537.1 hypothetical protein GCM10010981_09820 [Dyella nitratireducens]GLQ43955.1 hypothetical protein GCM10007902_38050 [Dyella nitratireducens]